MEADVEEEEKGNKVKGSVWKCRERVEDGKGTLDAVISSINLYVVDPSLQAVLHRSSVSMLRRER